MAAALAAAGSTRYYDAQGNETDEQTAKNTVINNTYNYYGNSGNQGEEAMKMGTDEVD